MDAALDAGEGAAFPDTPDAERAREREYALLARLLARHPDEALLVDLGRIESDPTPLGRAHGALAEAARRAEAARVEREFFTLFIGVGRGELLPYASYYRTGFLNERPLAELRRDLAALGIERASGVHEPEDHIAILCDVMAALAAGGETGAGRRIFERHLGPWAEQFFDDLSTAPSAVFYRAVGGLGAAFMAVERQAFAMED